MKSSYYSAFLMSVVLLSHGVFHAQGSPLVGTQNSSVAAIDSIQGRRHHAMRAGRRHFRHRRHHKPSHNKSTTQAPTATAKPSSSSCAQYSYKRYITVNSVHQLLSATKNARAGDMIELMPGTYYLGKNPQKNPGSPPSSGSGSPSRPSHNNPNAPQMAAHGTFVNAHGTPTDYITLCGPRDAILDGSDTPNYKGYAIRIIGSSYVRIAGLTVQRALKAIDVQNSVHCEIDGVLTRYTLQEGIRLRYNSAYNIIQNSEITHTGLMWAGYGEGIYVGTSKENSINVGNPQDHTDHNIIRYNTFGPGVQAENIDVKEFTTYGMIQHNLFNGYDIQSINGARSWVALKGDNWLAYNNTGFGSPVNGAGYRILNLIYQEGSNNQLAANTCADLASGAYCIYVQHRVLNAYISCNNVDVNSSGAGFCNCNPQCVAGAKSAKSMAVSAWPVPTSNLLDEDEVARPYWD